MFQTPHLATLLAVAIVISALPANAAILPPGTDPLPPGRVHAPLAFDSEDDLAGPPETSGVVSGRGTASDPYVISGWTFLVPSRPGIGDDVLATEVGHLPVISFDQTSSFVVVRDNLFLAYPERYSTPSVSATPNGPAGSAALRHTTETAIAITGAAHVAILDNEFRGLGSRGGVIRILEGSADIRVDGNEFLDVTPHVVLLEGSSVEFTNNVVRSRPAFPSQQVLISLTDPIGALVADNVLAFPPMRGWDSESVAIRLVANPATATTAGAGSVAIERNDIHAITGVDLQGMLPRVLVADNAIVGESSSSSSAAASISGTGAIARGGSLAIVDNVVAWKRFCARILVGNATVEGNTFDGCVRGLEISPETILGANTLLGGRTLDVKGVDDRVVDLGGGAATWLRVRDVERFTLRNGSVRGVGADPVITNAHGVTIEDIAFSRDFGIARALDLNASNASLTRTSVEMGHVAWNVLGHGEMRDVTARNGGTFSIRSGRPATFDVERLRTSQGGPSALVLSGSLDASVNDSSVTMRQRGIVASLASGGSLTVRNSTFEGNTYAAVFAYPYGPTLDLRHNWWGAASGPTAEGNPSGTGDAIKGPALYDPWLASPPA